MSLPFRHFPPINTSLKICIIKTNAPAENFPPTPKLTITETLSLTWGGGGGGNFLRGQLSGFPTTLKLTLTLTQTPTLSEGQYSSGGNCPDTISRPRGCLDLPYERNRLFFY